MIEEYKIDCSYYINGKCNWCEMGAKESVCVCIPNEFGYRLTPEECTVKRLLDARLEKKL